MKIVIAPDSFKESLSAAAVSAALAAGVRAVVPDADIDLCPMADGGEGTVAAMVAATGGRTCTADVFGPLGEPRQAVFGLLGGGREGTGAESVRRFGACPPFRSDPASRSAAGFASGWRERGQAPNRRTDSEPVPFPGPLVAVLEMAAASGLDLVPPDRRDPMLTTTYGTGLLIRAALDAGAGEILIGIGGSATVDGGCGCAQAVGVRFLNADGAPCICGLAGGGLATITHIDLSARDERIARTPIRVACDVTNPLTGPSGSAAVYGPQKGATPDMVRRLDAGLAHLADVIRRDLGLDVERLPGAGAAGGLGAGLVAFLGGRLQRGVEIVAAAVGLADRLAGADLCLTGEGRFDSQSMSGKTAVGVARLARDAGVPVICIPGQAEPGVDHGGLFAVIRPLVAGEVTVAQAIARPADLLARRAEEAVREFLHWG